MLFCVLHLEFVLFLCFAFGVCVVFVFCVRSFVLFCVLRLVLIKHKKLWRLVLIELSLIKQDLSGPPRTQTVQILRPRHLGGPGDEKRVLRFAATIASVDPGPSTSGAHAKEPSSAKY